MRKHVAWLRWQARVAMGRCGVACWGAISENCLVGALGAAVVRLLALLR